MLPAWLYNIFPHYLIIDTILEDTILDMKKILAIFWTRLKFGHIKELNVEWDL